MDTTAPAFSRVIFDARYPLWHTFGQVFYTREASTVVAQAQAMFPGAEILNLSVTPATDAQAAAHERKREAYRQWQANVKSGVLNDRKP